MTYNRTYNRTYNLSKISAFIISLGFTVSALPLKAAEPYSWNNTPPIKLPSASKDNGKTVLFDVSHGGIEGNADWVIDGAFSDFSDALVNQG